MKKVALSNGEWKLMNLLWVEAPRTIPQLVAALKEDTDWTKGTIHMMLSRMVERGTVRYERDGRLKYYYPILEKKDAVAHETKSFLSKVYNGSLSLMVTSMVSQNELTAEDIDELYNILHKAQEEGE